MVKRAKIILIVVMSIALCAAVAVGVIGYMQHQSSRDADAASGQVVDTYLRILTLSDLVLKDHKLSEFITIDDTYINNFADLLDCYRQFDAQLENALELTGLEDQYPEAVKWLRELCGYMTGLDKNDIGIFDFDYYDECVNVLHSGGGGSLAHNLEIFEKWIDE